MIKSIYWVLGLFLILACKNGNCPQEPDKLNIDFSTFLESIKDTDRFYTSNQWAEFDEKVLKFTLECYNPIKDQYNQEQKELFWSTGIQYFVIKHRNKASEILLNPANNFASHVRENVIETWKTPEEAFNKIFSVITGQNFDTLLQKVRTDQLDSAENSGLE